MLLEHRWKSPQIDPSAYVAPNAIVCGDGIARGTDATTMMRAQAEWFGAHRDDV